MTDTNTYTLKRGTFRTTDGEQHGPGAEVELPPHVVDRFAPGKFELKADDELAVDTDPDDVDLVTDPDAVEVDDEVPDDWDDLRALAVEYSGPEINGTSSKDEIQSFLADLPSDDLRALKDAV